MEKVKLKPASPGEVAIYLPYYPAARRPALPLALGLYKSGMLEGQRRVEGSAGVPLVASWEIKSLPADTTLCRVRFIEGELYLDYELSLSNTEFIGYLMEMLSVGSEANIDFPSQFYRKLLGYS